MICLCSSHFCVQVIKNLFIRVAHLYQHHQVPSKVLLHLYLAGMLFFFFFQLLSVRYGQLVNVGICELGGEEFSMKNTHEPLLFFMFPRMVWGCLFLLALKFMHLTLKRFCLISGWQSQKEVLS